MATAAAVSAESADPRPPGPCDNCGLSTRARCQSCRAAFYCSRRCQKESWRMGHREHCRRRRRRDGSDEGVDVAAVRVAVRPSAVHGRGVFATADIRRGERICRFEGNDKEDALRIAGRLASDGKIVVVDAANVFSAVLRSAAADMCLAHPDKGARRVRIGDPTRDSGHGVGQFVNDGDRPWIKRPALLEEAGQECSRYLNSSASSANSKVDDGFWYTATRDIKAGEEILSHYGLGFWLQKSLIEAECPAERLLCYALKDRGAQPLDLAKVFDYDDSTLAAFVRIILKDESLESEQDATKVIMKLTEVIGI